MGKIDAGELNETAFTLPAKKADRQLTVFARTVACAWPMFRRNATIAPLPTKAVPFA